MRRLIVLLALLFLALPRIAIAQCPNANLPATGGGFYRVIANPVYDSTGAVIGGQVLSQHTTERAAAARGLTEKMRNPGTVVVYTIASVTRVEGCFPTGRVDTVVVQLPGRVDTLTVVRTDTVYVPVADTATPPPVDTVTPPPTDTVTPPPVDTTPPVVVPPPPSSLALWSPEWRAGWQGAQAHPWWQLIAGNCAGNRYGDNGAWCAIVYRVTGDQAAGRKAVATWLATNPRQASGSNISMANHRREHAIEGAILYDALRPVMTPAQDSAWLDVLNRWAEIALDINVPQYQGGTRTNDEDQLIGVVLGMQCLDRVAGTTWSQRPAMANSLIPAVQHAIDAARGGELAESYAYNSGSAVLVALGFACLPAGTYHHAAEFLAERAQYLPFSITPDLRQKQQWWDEEHPRDFTGRLFRDMTGWLTFAGATGNPFTERLVEDVAARYGFVGYLTAEPWARGFYFWWPGKVQPAPSPARGSYVARGRGHLYVRTDSLSVMLMAANRTFEDHEWDWAFNASLYRDGEWPITSPRSYGQWPHERAEGANGLSLSGIGAMASRGMTWADSGTGWWALAGETQGPLYDAGYYEPPPSYVSAAHRTAVYTEVLGWSVLITRDSVAMSDPTALPKFNRYRTSSPNHQAILTAGQGKPWTIWHSPMAATLGGQQASWTTAGGQQVVVRYLSDAPVSLINVDEAQAFGTAIAASETAWHVRATTSAPVLWSVVLVGRGTPPAVGRSGDRITVGLGAGAITLEITSAAVVQR